MPNRNENTITITTKVNPDEFLSKDINGNYSLHFDKILPIDDEKKQSIMSCSEIRGTKWDVYVGPDHKNNFDLSVVEDNGVYTIEGYFDTAWSPPTGYYEALYKMLKEKDPDTYIEAFYMESGVGFLGQRINGEDTCYDWDEITRVEELDRYYTPDEEKASILGLFRDGVIDDIDVLKDELEENCSDEEIEQYKHLF